MSKVETGGMLSPVLAERARSGKAQRLGAARAWRAKKDQWSFDTGSRRQADRTYGSEERWILVVGALLRPRRPLV
jgi:hypothetical protein